MRFALWQQTRYRVLHMHVYTCTHTVVKHTHAHAHAYTHMHTHLVERLAVDIDGVRGGPDQRVHVQYHIIRVLHHTCTTSYMCTKSYVYNILLGT